MKKFLSVLILWMLLGAVVNAAPEDSVCLLKSHGGSATCIWTGPGKSYLLTAAHMARGSARNKPVVVSCPHPNPGPAQKGGARIIAVDEHADVALVLLNAGPLPYSAPVAVANFKPSGRVVSVGFDNLTWHTDTPNRANVRPATILNSQGDTTYCREAPYHGRSGGSLISLDQGVVVGVCSGYMGASPQTWSETGQNIRGIYASHAAIRAFLARHAPEALTAQPNATPQIYGAPGPAPVPQPQPQQGRPWVSEEVGDRFGNLRPYLPPGCTPERCPGGVCPPGWQQQQPQPPPQLQYTPPPALQYQPQPAPGPWTPPGFEGRPGGPESQPQARPQPSRQPGPLLRMFQRPQGGTCPPSG